MASPHAASLCTRMLANRPGVKSQEISVVKSEWQALGDGTHQQDNDFNHLIQKIDIAQIHGISSYAYIRLFCS